MNNLNNNELGQSETVPEGNELHHYFLTTDRSTCLELPSTSKILGCMMDGDLHVCAIVAAESKPGESQEMVIWQAKCHRLKHVIDQYKLELCSGAHVYLVQGKDHAYLVTLEGGGIKATRDFRLLESCQPIEKDMKYLASGHDSERKFHVFEWLWQSRN